MNNEPETISPDVRNPLAASRHDDAIAVTVAPFNFTGGTSAPTKGAFHRVVTRP